MANGSVRVERRRAPRRHRGPAGQHKLSDTAEPMAEPQRSGDMGGAAFPRSALPPAHCGHCA